MKTNRLLVLALGGTIAMVPSDKEGVTPGLGAAELVNAVPGLAALAQVRAETLSRVTSPNLRVADIVAVAERIQREADAGLIDACVVTQGTDTLEESAFLLDCLLDVRVPVVVTGAMRNPTLASADGAGNLLVAARMALSNWTRAHAEDCGVLVALLDEAWSAFDVVKVHPTRVNAFSSPQTGPVALIAEDRVIPLSMPLRRWKSSLRRAVGSAPALRMPTAPQVGLVLVGLGDDGALLEAVTAHHDHCGYRGLVLAAMGGGHVPACMAEIVGRLAAHMPVVVAGRMGGGPMLRSTYAPAGMEIDLLGRGVLHPGRLGPLKARMLLTVLLACGCERAAIAQVLADCG